MSRANATSFKPGQSGNPAGRTKQPRTPAEVRALARQKTVQMVEVLDRVATNPKAPPAARVAAATCLLDRGWGKPAPDAEGAAGGLTIVIQKFGEPDIKVINGEAAPDKMLE